MNRLDTISILDQIELERYSGRPTRQDPSIERVLNYVLNTQVSIKMRQIEKDYSSWILEAARSVIGEHRSLTILRNTLDRNLLAANPSSPVFRMLTVLPSGIYVGESEDLLAKRTGKGQILYPTIGLGDKIADIILIGSKEFPAGL